MNILSITPQQLSLYSKYVYSAFSINHTINIELQWFFLGSHGNIELQRLIIEEILFIKKRKENINLESNNFTSGKQICGHGLQTAWSMAFDSRPKKKNQPITEQELYSFQSMPLTRKYTITPKTQTCIVLKQWNVKKKKDKYTLT